MEAGSVAVERRLRGALAEIVNAIGECNCHQGYTSRGLVDPECSFCDNKPEIDAARAVLALPQSEARDVRQKAVADWCAAAFGPSHASSVPQRGIRLAEEAIEAAQAAGCGEEMVHKLVSHVFSNPPGDIGQELGGVGITLLALANAVGLSADEEEVREKCRVLAKPLEHFRKRNEAKNAAGFNVAPTAAPKGIA